jgi:hypothetical protein
VVGDRGIGGTGIVGVITGFGSVFVNGLEVAYTPATPVTVDGVSEPDASLKVGQLATIVASDDNGFHAVSIDLRHEVSGPVTSVIPNGGSSIGANPDGANPDGERFVVAGQTVAIDGATEGERTVHPGDWVAVSGLREPDGVIAASRIDQRAPGTVLVRGTVAPGQMGAAGNWRIGELSLLSPTGADVAAGANVTVRGTLANGVLSRTTVDPDVLSADPAAYFGGHVRRMVIESYVSAAGGHVRLGRGWLAASGKGVVVPAGSHRAIVQFERGAHGDFVATHLGAAAMPRGGAIPRGGDRPLSPRRGDRHGAQGARPEGARPEGARPEGGRPEGARPEGARHGAAYPFGPGRFEGRAWQDRRPEFGRGGFMPRRFGCGGGGCRRGRGPR